VLPGVMRKTVCEIAADKDIKLKEKDLVITDLLGADEVFLTNVIMQIMPVTMVEQHSVGDGRVARVTAELRKYLGEYIKEEYGISQ
ncbi:MAG: aminotransferase class IV, partial [Planctomycetota bacterium]